MTREKRLLWAAAIAVLGGWLLNLPLLFSPQGNTFLGIIPTVFLVVLLQLKHTEHNHESIWLQSLRVTISSVLGLLCLFSNIGFARTPMANAAITWTLFCRQCGSGWTHYCVRAQQQARCSPPTLVAGYNLPIHHRLNHHGV